MELASHPDVDTHQRKACQVTQDTQLSIASQSSLDTHDKEASQKKKDTRLG